MQLELDRVSQRYGAQRVLHEISLRLGRGRIGCLLGPSGCGKTTVLRCIAGFEPIEHGEIIAGEIPLSRPGFTTPPEERRIGMVFQQFALFPHLTVAGNVAFGLDASAADARSARVREVLAMVRLEASAACYPHELSGGQQQRVALARALAPAPELLLLDEPFSSLDAGLRERLAAEVREILKGSGATALLVTHDQREAFAMADEIGVMQAGRIVQWATPATLYHAPSTRFVAQFVGEGVLLAGAMLPGERVRTALGELAAVSLHPLAPGVDVDVLIRPDDVVHAEGSATTAQLQTVVFRGAGVLYTLRLPNGEHVFSMLPGYPEFTTGDSVGIRLAATRAVVFAKASAG